MYRVPMIEPSNILLLTDIVNNIISFQAPRQRTLHITTASLSFYAFFTQQEGQVM